LGPGQKKKRGAGREPRRGEERGKRTEGRRRRRSAFAFLPAARPQDVFLLVLGVLLDPRLLVLAPLCMTTGCGEMRWRGVVRPCECGKDCGL